MQLLSLKRILCRPSAAAAAATVDGSSSGGTVSPSNMRGASGLL
jgi:hypothetical protein